MEDFLHFKEDEGLDLGISIMAKESYGLLERLLVIASKSTNLLKELSIKLPVDGEFEAMIFNSLIISGTVDFNDLKNMEELEEDLLTLMAVMFQKVRFPDKTINEILLFIIERRMFYVKEYMKIIENKNYNVIKIYSSFYNTPLTGKEEYGGDSWDILSFQFALHQIISLIKESVKEAIKFPDNIEGLNSLVKAQEQLTDNFNKKLQEVASRGNKNSGCLSTIIILLGSISLLSIGTYLMFNI